MKKRERYLDVAKGLAILCIVLLHVENGVIPGGLAACNGRWRHHLLW